MRNSSLIVAGDRTAGAGCLFFNSNSMNKKTTIREATEQWLNEFNFVPGGIFEKMAKGDETISYYDSDSFRLIAIPRIACGGCDANYDGDLSLDELQEQSKQGNGVSCENAISGTAILGTVLELSSIGLFCYLYQSTGLECDAVLWELSAILFNFRTFLEERHCEQKGFEGAFGFSFQEIGCRERGCCTRLSEDFPPSLKASARF